MKRTWLVAGAVGLLAIGAFTLRLSFREGKVAPPAPAAGVGAPAAQYVGATSCAECHAKEDEAWRGSHHDLAMQEANERTVLGDFGGAKFAYAGVTSTFFRRDGRFYVSTDGAEGRLADFEVKYAFGVDPLQQYLIEFPDGRLQALGIAWDARPRAEGGQRWFHLYPDERVDFRDVLHWTGPALNWNHMCAECHSTGLRKGYQAEENRFTTRWTEINVSCEACHGAGSRHVAWASGGGAADDQTKGLSARLSAGPGSWVFDAGSRVARLTGPRGTGPLVETCGRCHSRRAQIDEDWQPGEPLAQTHRVTLLDEGLYHADGQILDEVYEYGSFLQSRMHAAGVACTDCHDPHSARLRVEGNAVCATCHQSALYDTPAHHHHRQAGEASRCVACHMPSRLYMVVDRRHDHGLRVPRPDLSVALGTPNACTDCHPDRPPAWAARAIVKWYGPERARGPDWARAFNAGRRREAGADRLLAEIAAGPATPAIVRATAIEMLAGFPGAIPRELVHGALRDADPLVRRAGIGLLGALEPARQWDLGAPLLEDPMRIVRLEAVSALAELPAALSIPPERRVAFDRAADEYRAAQSLHADRAEASVNLGTLEARLGHFDLARASYERALRLQPSFIPSYVNLADLERTQGRDDEGERILRRALTRQPDAADVHYALGLLLVRQGRKDLGLEEIGKAAVLEPDTARFAYAQALALDATGQRAKALAVLGRAHLRFTGDRDILVALMQLSAQAGDRDAAARWERKLRALDLR